MVAQRERDELARSTFVRASFAPGLGRSVTSRKTRAAMATRALATAASLSITLAAAGGATDGHDTSNSIYKNTKLCLKNTLMFAIYVIAKNMKKNNLPLCVHIC